ncbi:MAG: ribonuclease E/G [Clostridiales bacterium]|jgi:ribonuclease G|nr:ribonuclease E/G [Clostridiales bacterium]
MKKRIIMPAVKLNTIRRIILDTSGPQALGALTENGEPAEFISVSKERGSEVGNIYVGKVETVTKNGFAFVDIGLERNAFLNLNDYKEAANAESVKAGKPVIVQVTKDAYKEKGAGVTTRLTWLGRFFVVEPEGEDGSVSVSKKITDEKERERLAGVADSLLKAVGPKNKRVIVRTDAANAATSGLEAELRELSAAITETENEIKRILGESELALPALVYKAYSGACAMMAAELMAAAGYSVSEIVTNDIAEREALISAYEPKGVKVVYKDERLFAVYNLEKALDTTKFRQVHLPCGGDIVIERTDACVVVDVNSGQHIARQGMEELALKVNLEAAREIAKQLKLRNLGGAILIDFIGMKDPANAETLIDELKTALARDSASTAVEGITRLGFVEMTRKRVRNPLWR